MADSNRASLAYIEETNFNEVPDPEVSVTGTVTVAAPSTLTSDSTDAGPDFSGFSVGDKIVTSGFTNTENNGLFTIASVDTDTDTAHEIVVEEDTLVSETDAEDVTINSAIVFQNYRFTDESLAANTDTTQSEEIRPDRQVSDTIRTQISVEGDISWEFSAKTHDDLLEGFAMSKWSEYLDLSGTVSAVSVGTSDDYDKFTSDTAAGGPDLSNVIVGQWIETRDFTNTENNGYFKVMSLDTSTAVHEIEVAGTDLVDEADATDVKIDGSVLTNGVERKSYTFEKRFNDLPDADAFQTFHGCRIGTMDLDVSADAILTGSFGVSGAGFDPAQDGPTADDYLEAGTERVMNAIDHVSYLREGSKLIELDVMSISLSGDNNLRTQTAIGNLPPIGIGIGTISFTGNMEVYHTTRDLLNKYLSFEDTSVSFLLKDFDGNAYMFELEAMNYTEGAANVGGQDEDVMTELAFSAKVGGTSGKTFVITRFKP